MLPYNAILVPTYTQNRLNVHYETSTQVALSSPGIRMINHPYKGRGQGHVTHFKF